MATGIGGEVLWICPTLSSTNDIDDLSGNISTPSTHSGANVISETGEGGTHSISFNGTQGIDLGSATIHSGSTFSYSCWFKTTQAISTGGGAGLIGQYIIHNDRGPSLVLHTGRAQLYYQSNGGTYNANEVTSSTSTSNDGNWHHVAAVFEGSSGTAKVYVDGSLVATGSNVPSSVNQTRNLYLGDSNGGLLSGSMDDVRAFDRVLADHEIELLSVSRGYEPPSGIGGEKLWLCPSIYDTPNDLSGNGNHGTYNGGMSTVDDTSNGGVKAYNFNGSNQAISLTSTEIQQLTTTGSFSAWVYLDTSVTSGFRAIFDRSTTWTPGTIALNYSASLDRLEFVTNTNGDDGFARYTITAASFTGQWWHVCGVLSGGNVTLYLDGSQVAQDSTDPVPTTSTDQFVGATNVTQNEWIGKIDDIRVFDRALTTAEITSLASTRGYTSGGGGGEGEGGNLTFHPFNSTHVLD